MIAMKASTLFTAEEIAELRTRLGLSQEKLAEECGVNRTAVCHWESGIRSPSGPSAKHLLHLRDSLGKKARKKSG
jgi:DNA-binding transcriptional regulator YiaG